MTMQFRDLADKAAADAAITPEEIADLRRAGWFDGKIDPAEADAIFAVNDRLGQTSAQWCDFFVEALSEFIVNQVEPKGYVTQQQADWLMAKIDRDGRLESLSELELLVRVFERAISVPPSLRDYALRQIEQAVLTGAGPTRSGVIEPGKVTETEARLLRRVIFASASERPGAVSRSEAELLYRIKDAALGADNSSEWKRLFVQGVGNYLAGFASAQAPLSRERAGELEAFMNAPGSSLGSFFSRMGQAAMRESFSEILGDASGKRPRVQSRQGDLENARRIDPAEQAWLNGRIEGNGEVDEFDQALLDFLAEESDYRRP